MKTENARGYRNGRIWLGVIGLALALGAAGTWWQHLENSRTAEPPAAAVAPAEPIPEMPPEAAPAADERPAPEPEETPAVSSEVSDRNVGAVLDLAQAVDRTAPDARQRAAELFAADDMPSQVAGLALLAGQGWLDAQTDWTRVAPETALAAVDLCGALFGAEPADGLLEQWMAGAGGAQAAGEAAHRLLLESRLPCGGGSAALDLMQSVNDPQAIWVGLQEFAVNAALPASVRTEALLRVCALGKEGENLEFARQCVELARGNGDAWAVRAERVLDGQAKLPAAGQPAGLDLLWSSDAFAEPYPGMVEDVELLLRQGLSSGQLQVDAAAAGLRTAVANLDEATLSGPDRLALRHLRRLLGSADAK